MPGTSPDRAIATLVPMTDTNSKNDLPKARTRSSSSNFSPSHRISAVQRNSAAV